MCELEANFKAESKRMKISYQETVNTIFIQNTVTIVNSAASIIIIKVNFAEREGKGGREGI